MNIPFSRIARVALHLAAAFIAGIALTEGAWAQEKNAPKETAAPPVALFDGRDLGGWKKTDFDEGGAVRVENPFRGGPGAIVIEAGADLSGVTWSREAELPRNNYEITLEAMKIEGHDFFCGLTFPVGDTGCTLIVGGWGGMVVGLSSLDDMDASENETTSAMEFAPNRWYRIRLRVTPEKIGAWVDNREMFDVEVKERKIGLRWGDIEKSLPLGIATYQTKAAVRDIKLRRL